MWQERYPSRPAAARARKRAFRLKRLAPLCYRRLVRKGLLPKVGT